MNEWGFHDNIEIGEEKLPPIFFFLKFAGAAKRLRFSNKKVLFYV